MIPVGSLRCSLAEGPILSRSIRVRIGGDFKNPKIIKWLPGFRIFPTCGIHSPIVKLLAVKYLRSAAAAHGDNDCEDKRDCYGNDEAAAAKGILATYLFEKVFEPSPSRFPSMRITFLR